MPHSARDCKNVAGFSSTPVILTFLRNLIASFTSDSIIRIQVQLLEYLVFVICLIFVILDSSINIPSNSFQTLGNKISIVFQVSFVIVYTDIICLNFFTKILTF